MGRSLQRSLWAALPFLFVPLAPLSAATLPGGFAENQVASGMSSPTAMAIHPDGRIFVCQQGGSLRVIKNDTLLSTPFVTMSVNSSGERGLLGVAIDPEYDTNRFIYIYHTTSGSPIHNRVVRLRASSTNQDVSDGTQTVLFDLPSLSSATNHNGGALHFGLDGKLYIAVGENANGSNAQSLNTTLGKILRINKEFSGTSGVPSIPSDNPFFNSTSGNNRAIWARGLRNPFTFGVQPGTGRIHINDVGQNTWEEVNHGQAGRNYGWPACEGPHNNSQGTCDNPSSGFTAPIFAYTQGSSNCAIVGAAFYNPPTVQFGSVWLNRYFYGDFCGGFIRFLNPSGYTSSSPFATGISSLVDIAISPSGHLYYLARGGGALFKVRSTTTCVEPSISDQPDSISRTVGQTATFSVVAGGTTPLTFQWQRADAATPTTFVNITGATSSTLSFTAQASDDGDRFRVMVDNACSGPALASAVATLTVTAAGITADITTPGAGTHYVGGQTINFAGVGRDANGNPLPASTMTWRVDFHHEDHTHPHVPDTTGISSGSFAAADRGETSTVVFYRIHLTVNANGQTAADFVDVLPTVVQLTVATNPSGLQVTIDGQPAAAPRTVSSVVGVFRTIGTSTPQTLNGTTWTFTSWSDGGALDHEFRTPTANTTFTATFESEGGECVVGSSGQDWQNRPFTRQTGAFTVRFDATPSARPISGHVGLSNGPQNAYTGFANIVRFNTSGNIDARNGGAYAAASTIPYAAGTTYHFRLAVNIPAHTYSIFVRPEGSTNEITVGNNFAFRSEQAAVAQLDYWGVYVQPTPVGQLTVCNFAIEVPQSCTTANAGAGFLNVPFANQSGSFTAEFDATPSVSLINNTIGLSNGAQSAHTGLAAIARFNTSGTIDARNGGAYAGSGLTYAGGQTYHFRLAVNVPSHTYSIFVTRPGQAEQTVGSNFAFRSEQSAVTQLNNLSVWVGSPTGSNGRVCNFSVSGGGTLPPVPTGLTASPASTSQINVSWNAAPGATGYDLERDGSVVADVTSPHAHTGLAAGSTHTYRVRAKNAVGMSAFSAPVSATTQTASCNAAPSAPGNLRSTGVTSSSVSLAWDASPPVPNCSVQYQVRQGGTQVGQTSSTTHTVMGLSPSTTYSFTVVAVNQFGSSSPSNTLSVTTSPAGSNVVWSGVRSSGYGISPFPTAQGWTNAMTTMAGYFPGSTPVGVWLVGEVDFDSTGQILEFPHPNDGRNYGPLIVFRSTDKHEPYLDFFDSQGIKVWLQLEPGFANMNDLIDLVLNRYGHHPSVIGLGVDAEWYRNATDGGSNAPVTDSLAQAWEARVKSHNPSYTLFLKHFNNGDLPPNYRGNIVFVNDSQEHGSLTNFLAEMRTFSEHFFPNPVLFQFGYETDRGWWSNLATPIPKTIGDRLRAQTRQQCGMVWVDFTLREVLPSN
jgi:glucose/arabinose dehydrogenase